jgi:thioredoxin-dependent peroxiredoxin
MSSSRKAAVRKTAVKSSRKAVGPAPPAPPAPPAKKRAVRGAAPALEPVRLDQSVADFVAPATGGGNWRLKDARGRKLVLYFYPRDNTPGCTLEGQQFAALASQFAAAGVTVIGISRDSIASHEKFRDQMRFPFDLVSDSTEAICRQFDVIREKNMYGRKVLGIQRSTFLIDVTGVLRREWRGVKVDGHATEVLAAAKAL